MFDQGNYNDQESYPCQCGGNITHSEEYGWLCDACYESPKKGETMQTAEVNTASTVPISKTCPDCGITAVGEEEIGRLMGWRTINGVKKPQSKCRPCKNKSSKKKDETQDPVINTRPVDKTLVEMTDEELTQAIQEIETKKIDKQIADNFGLDPMKAANIIQMLWGGHREHESIFSYIFRAHAGVASTPQFTMPDDFNPRHYSSYDQEDIDDVDNSAIEQEKIAEFFCVFGVQLMEWCELNKKRRAEVKAQIQAHIDKEKEKERKKKEKAKAAKAAGKPNPNAKCEGCGSRQRFCCCDNIH